MLLRIVQAQFDLFWVAAQVSVPFFIVGICLGAQAAVRESSRDRPPIWAERTRNVRRSRPTVHTDRALQRAGVVDEDASV